MTPNPPKFTLPIREDVINYINGAVYNLQDLADEANYPVIAQRLVKVCNEPKIYKRMFAKRFSNQPYQEKNAWEFLNTTIDGWRNNTTFRFALYNANGDMCATIELKNGDTNSCEVGYWASENHRGVASNMLIKLCEIAKNAGFKQLFVMIAPDNLASQKVAINAGFVKGEPRDYRDKGIFEYFSKELS